MTDEQIKHMVDRFLAWKLPADFCPDNGITFDPIASKGTPYEFRREPIGTNLFSATQAIEMVRFMVEGLSSRPPRGQGGPLLAPERGSLDEKYLERIKALEEALLGKEKV